MKTFKLFAEVTISVYTTVEAETLEDAIKESSGREIEKYEWGIPNQEHDVWVSDEYDGLPQNIQEE